MCHKDRIMRHKDRISRHIVGLFVAILLFIAWGTTFAQEVPLLKDIQGFEYVTLRPHYRVSSVLWGNSLANEQLARAIKTWNDATNTSDFLTQVNPGEQADIYVDLSYLDARFGGITMLHKNGPCVISIDDNFAYSASAYQHEIGHCLGFAHDLPSQKDTMYPNLMPNLEPIDTDLAKYLKRHLTLIRNIK